MKQHALTVPTAIFKHLLRRFLCQVAHRHLTFTSHHNLLISVFKQGYAHEAHAVLCQRTKIKMHDSVIRMYFLNVTYAVQQIGKCEITGGRCLWMLKPLQMEAAQLTDHTAVVT